MKYTESICEDGKVISEYQEKSKCLFVQNKDRKKGFFHIIGFDARLGRRKGFIIERSNKKTYAIHLILSFTGFKKQQFALGFSKEYIQDYPLYWCRITWRTPLCWKILTHKRLFGSFEFRRGINAESLR